MLLLHLIPTQKDDGSFQGKLSYMLTVFKILTVASIRYHTCNPLENIDVLEKVYEHSLS